MGAGVDAVPRGRIGEYRHAWPGISGSARRHSHSPFGCVADGQRRFFHRHNRFCRDHVAVVSRVDTLSRLATDARKMRPAGARSRCHLSAHSRDVYALHVGSTARPLGLYDIRNYLGARNFWRDCENNSWRIAPPQTRSFSVFGNGMVGIGFNSTFGGNGSKSDLNLAACRRHRLHGRGNIFRERAPKVQSFRVAFVRPGRYKLPFSRSARLHGLRTIKERTVRLCIRCSRVLGFGADERTHLIRSQTCRMWPLPGSEVNAVGRGLPTGAQQARLWLWSMIS